MHVTYLKRIKNHECTWCGDPLPDGCTTQRCPDCKAFIAQQRRNKKQYAITHDLCTICGKPVECVDFATCESCREKSRNYNAVAKERRKHDR